MCALNKSCEGFIEHCIVGDLTIEDAMKLRRKGQQIYGMLHIVDFKGNVFIL